MTESNKVKKRNTIIAKNAIRIYGDEAMNVLKNDDLEYTISYIRKEPIIKRGFFVKYEEFKIVGIENALKLIHKYCAIAHHLKLEYIYLYTNENKKLFKTNFVYKY